MRLTRAILLSVPLAAMLAAPRLPSPEMSEERYMTLVKYLSSEKLKGRGTGTKELDTAAEYLANQFKKAGLQTVDGSYFQRFPVTTHAKLGKDNEMTLLSPNGTKSVLAMEKDFIPLNFTSAGAASGEVVFVGYGITAPEYSYDDYAGLDVKDKIVVMFRREPQETEDKSPFQGRVYTRHAQFDSKAINAKMHGARAAIVLSDVLSTGGGDLEKFASNAGPATAGIPFLMMKLEAAEKFFEPSGHSLRELHTAIDKDLKPRTFAVPGARVELRADVERVVKQVRNVLGYLPGETDEYVVVGAHYDHLGLGEQFSMSPSMIGKPHLGADDNASGTAGVVELARWMGGQPKRKRGVLFMAFAGEELGLLGSSYYVNHPLLPLDKAVAMINMDMIGRVKEGRVFVGGGGTGSTFTKLLQETPAPSGMHFDLSETAGYGSSDHTSFTTKQVPVLFFFSGLHGDYHKPSDTWDKINAKEAVNLLGYIGNVLLHLSGDESRPTYVRVLPPAGAHGSGGPPSSSSGGSGGYGPYFGSIPDFAEPPTGVRFADVREGSPAALAGLKAGDILVGWNGKKIQNLYDFTYALRQHKPGDEVEVEILRGTETVKAKVSLTARK